MDPISLIIGGIISLANKFFPDKDQAAKFEHELNMYMLSAEVQNKFKQMDINQTEASHPSVFVAGWRPAVGWMGVVAMGLGMLTTIVFPAFLALISVSNSVDLNKINQVLTLLSKIDTSMYVSITLQLLGLGALRTYEKKQGIQDVQIGNRSVSRPGPSKQRPSMFNKGDR